MKIFVSLVYGVKSFEEVLDFSENIINNQDFISISPCFVIGEMEIVNEQLEVRSKVSVNLVLASSRSLEPIDYKMIFDLDLVFGTGSDADYPLTNEIDFKDLVFAHILLEKPLSIYLESETPNDKPKVSNPAFKELEDWKL